MQKLMQQAGVKLDSIQTMYYVSPCCFVFLCIPFGIMEAPKLWQTPIITNPALLGANAICAFALNVSVFVLIGNTNALTLNVAGALRCHLLRLQRIGSYMRNVEVVCIIRRLHIATTDTYLLRCGHNLKRTICKTQSVAHSFRQVMQEW